MTTIEQLEIGDTIVCIISGTKYHSYVVERLTKTQAVAKCTNSSVQNEVRFKININGFGFVDTVGKSARNVYYVRDTK